MTSLPRMALRRMAVLAAVLAVTVGVNPLALGSGTSAERDTEPSADPRTRAHRGAPAGCSDIGLDGSNKLDDGDLNSTFSDHRRSLTVQSVVESLRVTAIAVIAIRGETSSYNLYVPAAPGGLAAEPAWEGLRAPRNKETGEFPRIGRWFACGRLASTKARQPEPAGSDGAEGPSRSGAFPAAAGSTVPVTTGASVSSSRAGGTRPSIGATSTSPVSRASSRSSVSRPSGTSVVPPTSTREPAPSAGALAYTGFGNAWLVWFGGALVSVGSAVLVLLRIRRNRD